MAITSMIPFMFLPYEVNKGIALRLIGMGGTISSFYPYLGLTLEQTGIKYDAKEYTALTLFYAEFYLLFFSGIIYAALAAVKIPNAALLAITAATILTWMILIQITMYPKILLAKKVREIEANIVFALRTMIIQIMSGISLFEAIKIIAKEKHGKLSEEFMTVAEQISAGVQQERALEEMATRNPSPALRKALWQIINGLKAGSEIEQILKATTQTAIRDKMISIREYGSKLRMYSLIFVLIGIIFPALGLTFLTVTASFSGLGIKPVFLWILLALIIVIEFMYVGFIKTARPSIMGD